MFDLFRRHASRVAAKARLAELSYLKEQTADTMAISLMIGNTENAMIMAHRYERIMKEMRKTRERAQ